MPRLEVDKERFKSFLCQFTDDIPYQVDLIKTLLDQLPAQVAEGLIEELYYGRVFKGSVYKVQHAVFLEDIHYFPSFDSMLKFLNSVNNNISEYNTDSLLALDKKTIQRRMHQGLPLCGYIITMEEIEDDDEPKALTRAEQFQ